MDRLRLRGSETPPFKVQAMEVNGKLDGGIMSHLRDNPSSEMPISVKDQAVSGYLNYNF